jgi:hypothetical protein
MPVYGGTTTWPEDVDFNAMFTSKEPSVETDFLASGVAEQDGWGTSDDETMSVGIGLEPYANQYATTAPDEASRTHVSGQPDLPAGGQWLPVGGHRRQRSSRSRRMTIDHSSFEQSSGRLGRRHPRRPADLGADGLIPVSGRGQSRICDSARPDRRLRRSAPR